MTRQSAYPGMVKKKYSGETFRTGDNLPFEDTPVGSPARERRMYASYTGAELLAGKPEKDARKAYLRNGGTPPAAQPVVRHAPATTTPRAEAPAAAVPVIPQSPRGASVFEIIRPFAEGQEDFIAALDGLRQTVSGILLAEHSTASKAIPREAALGAVILNGGVFGAARRSDAVRELTRDQVADHIRRGQPATYTENAVVSSVEPFFYGGPSDRRVNVGLRIMGDTLQSETRAATRTLQELAGNGAQLRANEPTIVLGSATPFIPPQAKEQIRAEILDTIGRTPTIVLAPSPILVPNA